MTCERTARMPRRRRASTVLAAGTTVMLLAGGGSTALAARAAPAGGIISTVAGGVGGPGLGTGISLSDANAAPGGCSLSTVASAAGSLYIADGSVRKVNARTGLLTTPAGTGAAGPLTTGGPAATAALGACGIAVDRAGNLVIADHLRHRIDVVPARTGTFYGRAMTAGHLYPVAGNGGAGAGGSGVPATKTALNSPVDVALDAAGNVVIADEGFVIPARRSGRGCGWSRRAPARSTGSR